MRAHSGKFAARATATAVQGALVAMFAAPATTFAQANEDLDALVQPANFVELGATDVSKKSLKFGEYNGLDKKGGVPLVNFGVRGGDAYGAGTGTRRWSVSGSDLGTTSRSLGASVEDQGKWSLGIGYDELRHNITDSFQTPFQGAVGGNNFTLPTSFGVINTTAPGANGMTAGQQAAFQAQDVHSDRKNTSLNGRYIFDNRWDLRFDFNHLAQSGAKLLGVAGQKETFNAIAWAGQTPMVILNPTNYTTDTFNLALNWMGDASYATVAYTGSMFRDHYNSVNFNNPFQTTNATGAVPAAYPTDTMSTMPGNDFHQLNLTGGYSFSPATKLVGGLSYARNTQNDAYAGTYEAGTVGALPAASLNGKVVTTHADLKLTNQTTKDLLLSAALKYNKRDNRTASNVYTWAHVNENTGAYPESATNTPMSNQRTQLQLAGDYRIDSSQKLRLAYEYEKYKRWCDNAAANNAAGVQTNLAYWGGTAYTATSCAEVPESKENKLAVDYKLRTSDDVSLSAGYAYARRKADINRKFYNPMMAESGGEGFEVPGFMAFFQTSRKEQQYKVGASWQASEKLTLTASGRYTDDKYDDLTYGVQKGSSTSLNLDATYTVDETNTVSAFLTQQRMTRDMTNLYGVALTTANATRLNIPIGATWTNKLREDDLTLGLTAKQGGLLGGKLELSQELTYSIGKSGYGTQFNYAAADNGGNTCSSSFYLTCGDLPAIRNELVQFKLAGSYQLDKSSKIIAGYMFQRLKTNDYFYNAQQFGSTPTTLLPTNQQAPSYNVNVLFAAYNYSFK